MPNLDPEIARI